MLDRSTSPSASRRASYNAGGVRTSGLSSGCLEEVKLEYSGSSAALSSARMVSSARFKFVCKASSSDVDMVVVVMVRTTIQVAGGS